MKTKRTFTRYAFLVAAVLALTAGCSNKEVNYPTQPPARTVESVETSQVISIFTCQVNETELEIACLDQSTGEIERWRWDFGDGSTSTSQNVVHRYKNPGTYIVSLRVSNSISSDSSSLIVSFSSEEGLSPDS